MATSATRRVVFRLHADGNGAYIGALAFPLIAIVFVCFAARCLRASRGGATP